MGQERSTHDPVVDFWASLSNDFDPANIFVGEVVVAIFHKRCVWNLVGSLLIDEQLKHSEIAMLFAFCVLYEALVIYACNISEFVA